MRSDAVARQHGQYVLFDSPALDGAYGLSGHIRSRRQASCNGDTKRNEPRCFHWHQSQNDIRIPTRTYRSENSRPACCVVLMTPKPFRFRTLPSGFSWKVRHIQVARVREVRPVRDVEGLHSEMQLHRTGHGERPHDAQIDVHHTGPSQTIESRSAEPGSRQQL